MAGKTKQTDRQTGYAQVFRALGDSHRLHILEMLREREMNAGELLSAVDVVQSTLSHHMKSLCEAELVVARKAGKCTYYSVSEQKVEEAYRFLGAYLGQGDIPETGGEVGTAAKAPEKSQVKTADRKNSAKAAEPVANKAVTATDVWGTAESVSAEKPEPEKNTEVQEVHAEETESLYAVMKKNGKKKKDKKDKKSGKKDKKKNKK